MRIVLVLVVLLSKDMYDDKIDNLAFLLNPAGYRQPGSSALPLLVTGTSTKLMYVRHAINE